MFCALLCVFKVCVVEKEKVCGFVVFWFSFCFFCFFWREKRARGVLKILSLRAFAQNQIRFRPKKSEKTYLTNRAFTSLFVIEPSRALTNAPFEHARKHTHKKRSRETLDCLRFKTVSSEVTARSPFKK